jgi:uncharacterized protein YrrD
MLWSFDDLRGYTLRATDGSLGSVHDLFFDDHHWTVRWLVVDTARLFGRRVLIAPDALGRPNPTAREFPVALSQDTIKNAPDVEADRPVSRQHEAALYRYYDRDPYWPTSGFALTGGVAGVTAPHLSRPARPPIAEPDVERGDPSLRSAREIAGYYIKASDDSVGHVEDLMIDEEGWAIRYLIVDTRNWLPGRKVLIAPRSVDAVSWAAQEVVLRLTRAQIENSPEYTRDMTMDRAYEERLYRHYEGEGRR